MLALHRRGMTHLLIQSSQSIPVPCIWSPTSENLPRGTRASHCSWLLSWRLTGAQGCWEQWRALCCVAAQFLCFSQAPCQTGINNGYSTRPSCCWVTRAVKQLWSLLCVPAAEAPCSRHANLQAQSQGTIKSLLLAILTDVHFSQDLPFDSPRIFHIQFALALQPQIRRDKLIQSVPILGNPGTASHLRLSAFWDPGVCQSVRVHWVPENEPITTKKKLSQFKRLSREVHGFL